VNRQRTPAARAAVAKRAHIDSLVETQHRETAAEEVEVDFLADPNMGGAVARARRRFVICGFERRCRRSIRKDDREFS